MTDAEIIALWNAYSSGQVLPYSEKGKRITAFARELAAHIVDERIQALIEHCPDAECVVCGEIMCPHGEPLHFHHDGCPACAQMENRH